MKTLIHRLHFGVRGLPYRSIFCTVLCLAWLAGCAPFKHTRGYIFPPQDPQTLIKVGMDRTTVLKALGSPVLSDPLSPHRWIYVQALARQKAFYHPEIVSQKILLLSFNASGNLDTIEWIPPSRALTFVPDPARTPVLGHTITPIQQMFRGIKGFHSKGGERSEP